MTRNEAVKIIECHAPGHFSRGGAGCWIETFERLGMLKVDEGPNSVKRAKETLENYVTLYGKLDADTVMNIFREANLTVTWLRD